MQCNPIRAALAALIALAAVSPAHAEIVIGVSFSQTGPAAALGIAPRNTMALFPEQIGGEKLRFVALDDATNSTSAAKNARRFVSEDKVDLIIGSTASPPAIAIADIARESETVQLAAAPIDLPEGKDGFTFRLPQGISLMAEGTIEYMKKTGIKSFGFLGYSDSYGESWLQEMTRYAALEFIQLYEAKYGVGSYNQFAANIWGAKLLLDKAIPMALKQAKPGTREFRLALKQALETMGEVVVPQGFCAIAQRTTTATTAARASC